MGYREPKPQTPSSALGVKGVIAGALAPRDSARAERDRHACAASEAQRSRPEAPLGDAGP